MGLLDFKTTTVVRTLDNDSRLIEALFFPEVSCFGPRIPRLRADLSRHLRDFLERTPPGEIYRRRGSGAAEIVEINVTLDPPQPVKDDAATARATVIPEAWIEPLLLRFHVVQWKHGEHGMVAFVPALGIEVVAPTPEELAERIPKHIRFALMRAGAATSLVKLAQLQRITELALTENSLTFEVQTPKRRAIDDGKEAAEKPVLQQVGTDLTTQTLPRAWELERVVEQLAEALGGRHARSVLLVGKSGVGKTSSVYELARTREHYQLGQTPFWATSGSRLVAGMSGFGMWQDRCRKLVAETSKARAVLYVGNLVELMEVGKSTHNATGIASFLRSYLGRGELLAISECTPEQVAFIERADPHLLEVFHRIDVEEPTPQTAKNILLNYLLAAQSGGPAPMDEDALEAVDQLHRRYATYSAFPARPIRFLQNLLRDRRAQRVIAPGEGWAPEPATLVRKDVIAAFARETGLPRFMLDESATLDLAETRQRFAKRVIGQENAIDQVLNLVATVKAALNRPRRPIASLLFVGPTGVGKTEMAKALAEFFFSDSDRLTRFDMSEYATPSAVERLVGGSFSTEGLLTAKVREQPFSVVLLDEFEKAHHSLFDLMLQVLGEGRLTDAAGRLADFSNAVVVMTSNLGAQSFQQSPFGLTMRAARDTGAHFLEEVREFFRPELFNRIDRVIPFVPLGDEVLLQIARRELDLIRQRDGMRLRGVTLEISDPAIRHLAKKGSDPIYGARPLKRAIEHELLTPLAEGLNAYAEGAKLSAVAELETHAGEQRLRVTVKASTTAAGTQIQAGPTGAAAEAAMECATLRRGVARLRRSSAVLSLQNEIFTLHRLRERLIEIERRRRKKKSFGDPKLKEPFVFVDDQRLARLKRLEPVAEAIAMLESSVVAIENELLLSLYRDDQPARSSSAADLRAAERDWFDLLLSIYSLRFDRPDYALVVAYGASPQSRLDLLICYQKAALELNHTVALHAVRVGKDGLETVSFEKIERMLATSDVQDSGFAITIHGPFAQLRFGPEFGAHEFVENKKVVARVVVETSNKPLGDFKPGTQETPDRRSYNLDESTLDDKQLKRQIRFAGSNWQQGLIRAMNEQMSEAARAVVDA